LLCNWRLRGVESAWCSTATDDAIFPVDFTAMGYGLLTLKKEECFVLNDAPPVDGAPVATIGAGVSCCDARMTSFAAGN
jgi:glucokinase